MEELLVSESEIWRSRGVTQVQVSRERRSVGGDGTTAKDEMVWESDGVCGGGGSNPATRS
jgi:hypothetical protein